ncbi:MULTISPECIES: hypothetical protein [unclassified Paenibacillus]|uniref:hypothetical protein n=1 Tax=unclassified Paenibacillus TaxID=185978 RepID=UPI000710FBAC|nr:MULTISPECIES: hypothetical protein [unclassified Paenibacillus]KQX68257.1 hypothetical protein ASD40_25650 [Paenibacillus sp. Root444D2]KRE48879.1 hypothetical protein ASG85_25540 [Paenibacillus sp. Soil724D2]
MPFTISDNFTMDETVEYHQDIHPLRIALLNLKNSAIGLEFLQQYKISRIECFRFDSELTEKLQLGDKTDICGLIAITTNTGSVGLREFAIPCKTLKYDLTMWVALFQRMKGLNLVECMNYTQLNQEAWGPVRLELIDSALMDLFGKVVLTLNDNKDKRYIWDRTYLFDHTQAYISF